MLQFLTPVLWVFVTLVFGLDAVAQPCDLRMQVEAEQTSMSDMPCHEGVTMASEMDMPDAPDHQKDTCCCAALLTNAVTFERIEVQQPSMGISVWSAPLPDNAYSVSIEYEPPPPRA